MAKNGASNRTAARKSLPGRRETEILTVLQWSGFILSAVGALCFLYAAVSVILLANKEKAVFAPPGPILWRELILINFETIVTVLIGIICSYFALRFFSKAGSLANQVISDKDRALLEPLIREHNKEAIGEYIRLSSLSGFPGTFHKLGFTGLPLATVVLTLILLVVSLFVDGELSKSTFDMAKLTLGAFLGSFVQRNVEQERLIQGHPPLRAQVGATQQSPREE
jgi:hypothetical protein